MSTIIELNHKTSQFLEYLFKLGKVTNSLLVFYFSSVSTKKSQMEFRHQILSNRILHYAVEVCFFRMEICILYTFDSLNTDFDLLFSSDFPTFFAVVFGEKMSFVALGWSLMFPATVERERDIFSSTFGLPSCCSKCEPLFSAIFLNPPA